MGKKSPPVEAFRKNGLSLRSIGAQEGEAFSAHFFVGMNRRGTLVALQHQNSGLWPIVPILIRRAKTWTLPAGCGA